VLGRDVTPFGDREKSATRLKLAALLDECDGSEQVL
jgi:hypothetical protein